jgi:hypothetical protein
MSACFERGQGKHCSWRGPWPEAEADPEIVDLLLPPEQRERPPDEPPGDNPILAAMRPEAEQEVSEDVLALLPPEQRGEAEPELPAGADIEVINMLLDGYKRQEGA